MISPGRRGPRHACRAFVSGALAFAVAFLVFEGQLGPVLAGEQTAPAIRIRGNAGQASSSAGAVADQFSFDEVGERDVDLADLRPGHGDEIVTFALAFVGYPYVWAGNSPAGFDCSGFTEYVVLNTLGIDIGHALGGQPAAGVWVDRGAWQPGDLVFFQNTYQAGLSHAGIYIGDGLFVHAENEGTGVTISSMYSDYYGPRYWGSVRAG